MKQPLYTMHQLRPTSPLAKGRGLKPLPIPKMPRIPSSPLAKGRGLKLRVNKRKERYKGVAPREGAWIETPSGRASSSTQASPLAKGRGLKP